MWANKVAQYSIMFLAAKRNYLRVWSVGPSVIHFFTYTALFNWHQVWRHTSAIIRECCSNYQSANMYKLYIMSNERFGKAVWLWALLFKKQFFPIVIVNCLKNISKISKDFIVYLYYGGAEIFFFWTAKIEWKRHRITGKVEIWLPDCKYPASSL